MIHPFIYQSTQSQETLDTSNQRSYATGFDGGGRVDLAYNAIIPAISHTSR